MRLFVRQTYGSVACNDSFAFIDLSCGPSKQRLLQSKQSSRLQSTCALGGDYIRRRGLDELLKRSSSSPVPNSKLRSHSFTPTTVQSPIMPTPTPPTPPIPTPPGPTPTPPSSRPSTAPKNQSKADHQTSNQQHPTKIQADLSNQQRETRESSRTMKPSSKNITRVHIRSRSISPATPLTPSTPLFHYSTHHQLTNQLSSPPTLMPRSDSFDRLRGRCQNGDDQSDTESHISIYNTRAPRRPNPRREELLKAQRLQQQRQLSQRQIEAERAARRLELEAKQRELAARQAKLDAERRERENRNYEQMMAYKRQQETMSRQNGSPAQVRRHPRQNHLRSRTIGCIQPVDREVQRGIAERWARINRISNNYDKQLIMPKYQKSIH